ncbi:MAG: hypothetical protein AAF329_27120, partial [Cyanobacteria bacterium P01_A01_bin.17]
MRQQQQLIAAKIEDLETAIRTLGEIDREDFGLLGLPPELGLSDSKKADVSADNFRLTRFKGMSLSDAVIAVLSSSRAKHWKIDEIVQEIYYVKAGKAKKSCRASITAVLHRLKKSEKIKLVE